MDFNAIRDQITAYRQSGLKLFTTSSFQTHSLVLLHLISRIDKSIPVFLLIPDIISRKRLHSRIKLPGCLSWMCVMFSAYTKKYAKGFGWKITFASDPDYCCYLNKTQPLEPVLAAHDVWINGVRGDQSDVRKRFRVEEPAPFDTIRFHPMLDWSPKMIYAYRKEYNIPHHPMEDKGYFSIGCEPCTRKLDMETGSREGRWFGLKKTECGLNTDLVGKG